MESMKLTARKRRCGLPAGWLLAAAIALAGLEIALAEGHVARDERVVLLVTGTGLKDVPAASRRVRVPEPVAPTLEAVEAFLR